MNRLYKTLYQFYLSISGSIALWPSVIALGFLALGFSISYFERTALVVSFEKNFLFWLNTEPDNARLILTTVSSGTITLMVFSFSMVMIVLSQATSNLTPRVVPGLISDKMNQVVLGVNIGTILYTLVLILSFKPGEENASVPMLGILLAVLFSILCVGLFVYFIHSISKAIKPDTILTRIYYATQHALEQEVKRLHRNEKLEKSSGEITWFELPSLEAGYLRQIETDALHKIAQEHDLFIEVPLSVGKFVVPGLPFLRVSKNVQGQKEVHTAIQECFIFSMEEVASANFETGLRQISEVAVKALSPGINDPGTALSALDFLTLLLQQRMISVPANVQLDAFQNSRIIRYPTSLETLIYNFFTPIRTYGNKDVMVTRKLLLSLQHFISTDAPKHHYTQCLAQQVTIIRDDAEANLTNQEDRRQVNLILKDINSLLSADGQKVELLS